MSTDFESVKKLPSETRVVELRKLIANLKKHIEDHNKDIRTAEILLVEAEKDQRVLEREIGRTVEKTQEKYKTESDAPKAPIKIPQLETIVGGTQQTREVSRAAERPLSELYTRAKNIYESQRQTGVETYEQRKQLYDIRKGLDEKKRDIEEGRYQAADQQRHLMTSTEQLLGTMYQGNKEGQNKTYRTNN